MTPRSNAAAVLVPIQSPNTARELQPGLWFLRFPVEDAILGELCEHLVPPLSEASKAGPLILLAWLPAGVRTVHHSMVTFWLDAMTRRGVGVKGIAVITTSLAVRAVVNGFGLAMKIREKPILACTFPTEEEAITRGRAQAGDR